MKNRIINILLAILITGIIVTIILIVIKYGRNQKKEKELKDVVEIVTTKIKENKEENKPIGNIEVKGYKVEGIIKISKINIEYPILEKTNKESLKLSITKFWGEKINQKGNVVLAGHNNLNNKMFGKIDKLENGDIIELTDSQMVAVEYQVFDKYIIDPNDINCIFPVEENTREVTLITCTNRDKNRLVVKAREII